MLTIWRKDTQVDWVRTDSLVLSGDSVSLVFNLLTNWIEVSEPVSLLVQELGILISILDKLKDERTSSDNSTSTGQKISESIVFAQKTEKKRIMTHFPTKFSSTDDFPADWPPTTAIWGNSKLTLVPSCENASCTRLITGINACIPWFAQAMTDLYGANMNFLKHEPNKEIVSESMKLNKEYVSMRFSSTNRQFQTIAISQNCMNRRFDRWKNKIEEGNWNRAKGVECWENKTKRSHRKRGRGWEREVTAMK